MWIFIMMDISCIITIHKYYCENWRIDLQINQAYFIKEKLWMLNININYPFATLSTNMDSNDTVYYIIPSNFRSCGLERYLHEQVCRQMQIN